MRISVCIVLLFLTIATILGKAPKKPEKSPHDVILELERFNSMVSGIKDLCLPEMSHGIIKIRIEYNKESGMRIDSKLAGRTETKAAYDRTMFWFWSRSFDQSSVYYCQTDRIHTTRLKPSLHPRLVSCMLCADEIPSEFTVVDSPSGLRIAISENGFTREVEFRDGLIVLQEFRVGGKLVASMKPDGFQETKGFTLPKNLKITWYDDGISATINLGKAFANTGIKPEISMPQGLSKVNLEGF